MFNPLGWIKNKNKDRSSIKTTTVENERVKNMETRYSNGNKITVLESWGWGLESIRQVWIRGVLQR
jgi:hypothetical protein